MICADIRPSASVPWWRCSRSPRSTWASASSPTRSSRSISIAISTPYPETNGIRSRTCAAAGVLAGERLDEPGQLRPEEVEQRAGGQLGDPAAAVRSRRRRVPTSGAVVEALDELDRPGRSSSGPSRPVTKCGRELPQVAVDERDHVAARRPRGRPRARRPCRPAGAAPGSSASWLTTWAPAAAATCAVASVDRESTTINLVDQPRPARPGARGWSTRSRRSVASSLRAGITTLTRVPPLGAGAAAGRSTASADAGPVGRPCLDHR